MCSAMAIDAVAAGDGALRTEVTGPTWLIRKSSTREPSGSTAWARTPAGALVTSPVVSQGRYVLASARYARRTSDPRYSRTPVIQCCLASRRKAAERASRDTSSQLTSVRRYPSRASASTALGPRSDVPSTRGVRWTPRNGYLGSGTG
jgi:hypothetical protein